MDTNSPLKSCLSFKTREFYFLMQISNSATRLFSFEKYLRRNCILQYSTYLIWFLFLFQRAMPSGFFVLQRFFLRVDSTLIRVFDTRLYHDVTKSYLLREYSERESRTQDLNLPSEIFTQENEIVQHLNVVKEITEKLNFPSE